MYYDLFRMKNHVKAKAVDSNLNPNVESKVFRILSIAIFDWIIKFEIIIKHLEGPGVQYYCIPAILYVKLLL